MAASARRRIKDKSVHEFPVDYLSLVDLQGEHVFNFNSIKDSQGRTWSATCTVDVSKGTSRFQLSSTNNLKGTPPKVRLNVSALNGTHAANIRLHAENFSTKEHLIYRFSNLWPSLQDYTSFSTGCRTQLMFVSSLSLEY